MDIFFLLIRLIIGLAGMALYTVIGGAILLYIIVPFGIVLYIPISAIGIIINAASHNSTRELRDDFVELFKGITGTLGGFLKVYVSILTWIAEGNKNQW